MEERIGKIIEGLKWKRAWNKWYPHSYFLEKWHPTEFTILSKAIEDSPFYDFWKGNRVSNLYVNGWKLWRIEDVLNRRRGMPPTDGYCDGEQSFVYRREHPC